MQYGSVYPGIDLAYYIGDQGMEYDFIVAAGADSSQIKVLVAGADRIELVDGDLVLHTANGKLVTPAPILYQGSGSDKQMVSGSYTLLGGNQFGFSVGNYDRSQPLVIDPVIGYSSYLGGDNLDEALAVTTDAAGNIYISGQTVSSNFPGSNRAAVGYDIFTTKLNSNGVRQFSTLVGGAGEESAEAISIGSDGAIYMTGATGSEDLPVTPGAFQPAFGGGVSSITASDGFILKLTASGQLSGGFLTYLGGGGDERAHGLVLDNANNVYIVGSTDSNDNPGSSFYPSFPVTANAFQPIKGGGPTSTQLDGFITKFSPTGSFLYSSYHGGEGSDSGFGIAIDRSNNTIYLVGDSNSTLTFPQRNPITPPESFSGDKLFITQLVTTTNTYTYSNFSTLFGGNNNDHASNVVFRNNVLYLGGWTFSTNFPTANASQPTNGYGYDGYVSAFRTDQSFSLLYSTYLGGNADDEIQSITVDGSGNVHAVGDTRSDNYPRTADAAQSTFYGTPDDGFYTKFDPAGARSYSTYLGGNKSDTAYGVSADAAGNVYVVGTTQSFQNFPLLNAQQPTIGGPSLDFDSFITKFLPGSTPPTPVPSPTACNVSFTDVPTSNVFYNDIRYLACRGIVTGSGGLFRPNDNTRRGEFAKIAVVGFGIQAYTPATPTFGDVPTNNVFYNFIEAAAHAGAITGFTQPSQCSGTSVPCFRPNNNVTRAQVAIIVQRIRNFTPFTPATPTFADVPTSNFAYAAIETLAQRGIISGGACGGGTCFRPNDSIRRGELSKVVSRAIQTPLTTQSVSKRRVGSQRLRPLCLKTEECL